MNDLKPIGLFAFSCLIASLALSLPLWLILLSVTGICWQFWRGLRIPNVVFYTLMAILWSFLIFDSTKILHRDTMTAALVLGCLFSVLAPPHKHRVMRFHLGLFFLLVSILIVPKATYPLWLYFLLSVLVCMSLVLHHVPSGSLFSLMSLGKSLLKLALPLSILLMPVYFFFPEIRTPQQNSSESGMSGDLEPGQLASLVLSDKLAFRVRFLKTTPAPSHLYWRAQVLEKSRGMSWSQGISSNNKVVVYREPTEPVVYEIMLDTRLGDIIPLLEQTTSFAEPPDASQLLLKVDRNTVTGHNRYLVAGALPSTQFTAFTPPSLDVPTAKISPRVQALVDQLKAKVPKDQVRSLLDFYQSFQYTLKPGALKSADELDEFLFETKKGFCEHFAASFASLLRYAGTPARVVVGFQGGNQLGSTSFYQITNADAHAWTEVWIDGAWIRIDPSSVVMTPPQPSKRPDDTVALITTWLSFATQHLLVLIQEWSDDIGMLWIGVGIIAIGLLVIQIYRLRNKSKRIPRWEQRTKSYLRTLEKLGIKRGAGETVANYLKRVGEETGDPKLFELGLRYNECKFSELQGAAGKLEAALSQSRKSLPALRKHLKPKAS